MEVVIIPPTTYNIKITRTLNKANLGSTLLTPMLKAIYAILKARALHSKIQLAMTQTHQNLLGKVSE